VDKFAAFRIKAKINVRANILGPPKSRVNLKSGETAELRLRTAAALERNAPLPKRAGRWGNRTKKSPWPSQAGGRIQFKREELEETNSGYRDAASIATRFTVRHTFNTFLTA